MNIFVYILFRTKKHSKKTSKAPPGPGTYDLDFSNELKTLDYQLSLRYKHNPFGSQSPRFKKFTKKSNLSQNNNIYINNTVMINAEKHRKAELIHKYLKKRSEDKSSYYF